MTGSHYNMSEPISKRQEVTPIRLTLLIPNKEKSFP